MWLSAYLTTAQMKRWIVLLWVHKQSTHSSLLSEIWFSTQPLFYIKVSTVTRWSLLWSSKMALKVSGQKDFISHWLASQQPFPWNYRTTTKLKQLTLGFGKLVPLSANAHRSGMENRGYKLENYYLTIPGPFGWEVMTSQEVGPEENQLMTGNTTTLKMTSNTSAFRLALGHWWVRVCVGRVSPNGLLETAHEPDLIGEEKLESNKGLYGNPSRQRLRFKSSPACQGPAYITPHPPQALLPHPTPIPLCICFLTTCTHLHQPTPQIWISEANGRCCRTKEYGA